MSSAQLQLDQQYSKIMKNHPFGVALYRPLSRSIFHPGACGYFDDFGKWNPIAHLESDVAILNKKGLAPVEDEIEKAPVEDGIKWGPKTSSNVRAKKISLSAGVDSISGIPVGVSAAYSYSVDKDVGALLLTKAPIVHEHYYHTSPFKNWCRSNALSILKRWPEVKRHGLWIVTSTYTTQKCGINMWSSHGKSIEVGFSADIAGIGSIGPSTEWHRSRTDEGWGEYTAKVCRSSSSNSWFLMKSAGRRRVCGFLWRAQVPVFVGNGEGEEIRNRHAACINLVCL
ncbi:hypothetical protein CPC08DRAFT_151865 [Agrocybe pediades]|nr:hypothetical protein CPC08DRAFT_151865 [Agrocybe pediades]